MSDKATPESPLAKAMRTGKLGGGTAKTTASPTVQTEPSREIEKVQEVKPLEKAPVRKRDKQSVYLSPEIHKWLKHEAVEQGKEISEIVEEALYIYKAQR